MEPSDLGRRIRDFIIPEVRKKYHITGQYLSLEAAVEVIQVVRLVSSPQGLGNSPRSNSANSEPPLSPRYTSNLNPIRWEKRSRAGNRATVVRQASRSRHSDAFLDPQLQCV